MYTLAFDTTARSCSIALLKDDKVIKTFSEEMDFGQGEILIPEIQKILQSQNLSFDDLSLLIVCSGPGSFTGVRSGISAARSFGIAKKQLTIMGVSAFDAYAFSLKENEISEINAVIIETKRDDFYVQFLDKNLKKISEPKAATREEIINELKNKKVTLIGDGVERFLYNPTGLSLHQILTPLFLPVETLALCGINKLNNKIVDFPKPLYLRAPDVCLKQ